MPHSVTSKYPILKSLLILLALFALAFTWRCTAFSEYIRMENIKAYINTLESRPLFPVWVIGMYIVASILLIPITLMIGATAMLFSPGPAIFYAMTGCVSSAIIVYTIGAWLGTRLIRKIWGRRLNHWMMRINEPGVLKMTLVRTLPVAQFTILGLLAGASRVNIKDYILGTAIGMIPWVLTITVFLNRILQVIRNPTWCDFTIIVSISVFFGVIIWWIHKKESRDRRC